jgi:hypothetical protein
MRNRAILGELTEPKRVLAMVDRTQPSAPMVVMSAVTVGYMKHSSSGGGEGSGSSSGPTSSRGSTATSTATGLNKGADARPRLFGGVSKHATGRVHEAKEAQDVVPFVFPCGYAGAEEAWIPDVLLAGCQLRQICLVDIMHDVAYGRIERSAWAMVPGAVVVLQTQQMPLIKSLASRYHVPLSSLFLVHISDGNIWQEHIADTVRHYTAWRHVFRQYWVPDKANTLAAASGRGELSWFPIGMNPQWVEVMHEISMGAITVPIASARRHFIAFLGSTDKSERAARIRAVNDAISGLHVGSLSTRTTASSPGVFHSSGRHSCYGSDCADAGYIGRMLQSAFCLHLPGSSVESNRLYEGLEGGCVPVIIRRFGPGEEAVGTTPDTGITGAVLTSAALLPLDNVTGTPPPFVVVDHETDLFSALEPFAVSSQSLDQLQQRARSWWHLAKQHYAHTFESRICPK